MLQIINLNKEEIKILEQHYKKSNCRLTRERAHCVLLSNKKRNVSDIASIKF